MAAHNLNYHITSNRGIAVNSNWQAFLVAQGATVTADGVTDFGDPAAELAAVDGDLLCDRSDQGLLQVGGSDAQSFLQGQFSNDVREVTEEHAQLSSYCSPKGRMLAIFQLLLHEGNYLLRLPLVLTDAVEQRLQKFRLMSKVTLRRADDLVSFGCSGAAAATALAAACGPLPSATDGVVHYDGVTIVRVAGSLPRFELYGSDTALQPLWQAVAAVARPVGRHCWALLDLRAGLPTIEPQTVEAFVPQMANLQLVNGVSFRKGCYPGQEVVARMQYLGSLKRRMYLAHIEADEVAAGDPLYAETSRSGQGAGRVVSAQPAPEGGYDLLVVAEISCAEEGHLQLGDANGAPLQLRALPYAF